MTGDTEQQTVTRWMAGLARSAMAALLLSVLGAGAAAARQQIFVRVGDGTQTGVAPGGQISIPIVVDMSTAGGLDLASITFELNWDPSLLSYVSASPGSFGSVVFNESQTGSGLLTTGMFNAAGTTSSFTLATVVFRATAVVPDEGQLASIAINVTAAGNEAGSSILGNVVGVDLELCIGLGGLLGDVNDDGVVNIIDAQQIARFAVGLPPPPDPERVARLGDVTEDGVPNIIDAQQIARFSVGLPTPGAPRIGQDLGRACATITVVPEIVFASDRDGDWDLYAMNPDGENLVQLTDAPSAEVNAAWSPDGTRIAFVSDCSGDQEIFVMELTALPITDVCGRLDNLTNHLATDNGPAWSPDGERIAFQSHRDGNNEIYVMDSDGTNPRNLTNNPPPGVPPSSRSNDGEPDWSPDGTRIVFSSWRDGSTEMWVMDADGANPRQLTHGAWGNNPAWSPDGRIVGYSAFNPIYLIDVNDPASGLGIELDPLTDTGEHLCGGIGACYMGSWSRDGTEIVFFVDVGDFGPGAGDNLEIYVMRRDGTGLRRLTDNSALDADPDWRWSRSANRAPTVTITSPANGVTFMPGETVVFEGSATDPEDGTLTGASVVWTSTLDGQIGTGTSFTRGDLSVGAHTITLTATDGHGATGASSIGIEVLPGIYASSGSTGIFGSSGPSDLYVVQPSEDVLIGRIRTSTGFEPVITDVALSPSGSLFGISFEMLYSIGRRDALAIPVGKLGITGANALGFDQHGNLFGATGVGMFFRVSTTSGEATPIGSWGPDTESQGDIAFAQDGRLFGTARTGTLSSVLVSIDPNTGQATPIDVETPIGFENVWGLAFAASDLFGLTSDASSATGQLIRIDPVSGAGTFVRDLTFDAFGAGAPRRVERNR